MTPSTDLSQAGELLKHVRLSWPNGRLREVRMFGVLALMVDDVLAVAAHNDGSLLVRVDPADDDELLERPHASRAQMGNGRAMGTGWIRVDARALRTDNALHEWLRPVVRYLDTRRGARTDK